MGISQLLRKIATGTPDACEFKTATVNKHKPVDILPGISHIKVKHNGKTTAIKRNQDPAATINPLFAKVSRPCPPFCIQPMQLAPNVETIGELELLEYLQQACNDESILIVDSRITEWVEKGTIPGSTHIPWTSLARTRGASVKGIVQILRSQFGMQLKPGKNCGDASKALANKTPEAVFDFSDAKTLVLFCNGVWCMQTPESIEALLSFGYPQEKLKYYRDGMQGWESLGLSTVKDDLDLCKERETKCDSGFISVEKQNLTSLLIKKS